jgi:hypothetical protein
MAVGGWDEFHANHIATLTAALKSKLLPLGYTASNQPSLQIRLSNIPIGRPRSDVTIYDTEIIVVRPESRHKRQ